MNKIKINLKRYGSIFLFFVLFTILLPLNVLAQEIDSKVIRVGWYEGTYNTTGPNDERNGYSYEYQQTLSAYTGWTYEYVKADWQKLIKMLQNGEIDLMGGVSYTEERASKMLFSELPMGEEKYYLYADLSKTDISVSDLTTLNNKRIGILSGSLSTTQFCEWEKKHGLHTTHVAISNAKDVHKMLEENKIDGFVLNESPQWEKENLSAIIAIGGSDNYFVVNKNRSDLKEKLDVAMRKIQHDNPFYTNELYKRYLLANSVEVLTDEEQEWLKKHGTIKIGYLKDDAGVSLDDTDSNKPVGIINDYIEHATNCFGKQTLKFKLLGFDSQEEQLRALKNNEIDMIFHVNQNPYEAEQSGIILSNTVFEVSVAVLTDGNYFDENAKNTIAVTKGNLLSKWYISYNYPQWKIREYDSFVQVRKAVRSGKAEGFIVKNGQTSKALEDNKIRSAFLTKASDSSFAVNRTDTILLSILNKTLTTLSPSTLSGAFSMYENASKKVTLVEFIKDNLLVVTTVFILVVLSILLVIIQLLMKARKAQVQAEIANTAKTDFLSRMSHDMRTPLNGIVGLLKINQAHFDDRELVKENHKKMQVSANHLLSLINDVLQMSKIEDGKITLMHEIIDFKQLFGEVKTIISERAVESGILLEFEKEKDMPYPFIYGSSVHLRQIFLNIYGNCIKYNRLGGKINTIMDFKDEQNGTCIYQWTISDTGIGMSQEFLKHIFEPFAQEKEDARSEYQGTGLGMPIVKGLLDQMGGTIAVTSKVGIGSTFIITIPFEIAPMPVKTSCLELDSEEIFRDLHFMLAEDNELNAEIAQMMLEDMGAEVTVVCDGKQAVDLFVKKPQGTFDAILTDIMMPVMDGLAETKTIRHLERLDAKTIPIIAMTANAFKEDEEKCLEAGMDAHIAKPLDFEKVKETIWRVVVAKK